MLPTPRSFEVACRLDACRDCAAGQNVRSEFELANAEHPALASTLRIGDGRIDLADAIWTTNFPVRRGSPTECERAADANGDDRIDLIDPIYTARHEFLGGDDPTAPFPDRGVTASGGLTCPPGSVAHCPEPAERDA